jgi:hypothetical protein
VQIAGSIADRSCVVAYREGGSIGAIATVGRDQSSLEAEERMARGDQRGLEALMLH